jgi:hypothetical protein
VTFFPSTVHTFVLISDILIPFLFSTLLYLCVLNFSWLNENKKRNPCFYLLHLMLAKYLIIYLHSINVLIFNIFGTILFSERLYLCFNKSAWCNDNKTKLVLFFYLFKYNNSRIFLTIFTSMFIFFGIIKSVLFSAFLYCSFSILLLLKFCTVEWLQGKMNPYFMLSEFLIFDIFYLYAHIFSIIVTILFLAIYFYRF